MKLSIIILSYNSKQLLWQCLSSIQRLKVKHSEIIVFDNASSDDSVSMVKEQFPHIKVIRSPRNLGFARGINEASRYAQGEYLMFLNSDADLTNNAIEDILTFMDKDGKIGVVGGMLLNGDGSRQRSYGSFYTLLSTLRMLAGGDKIEMLGRNYTVPTKVDWVSGGYMIIRTTIFKKLDGFDEHFFMYMEDVELCYRVHKEGYKVIVFPKAVALHQQHGSSNRSFAIERIYEGLLYFYKKHRSSLEYYIVKSVMTCKAILLYLIGFFTRNKYLMHTYRNALIRVL